MSKKEDENKQEILLALAEINYALMRGHIEQTLYKANSDTTCGLVDRDADDDINEDYNCGLLFDVRDHGFPSQIMIRITCCRHQSFWVDFSLSKIQSLQNNQTMPISSSLKTMHVERRNEIGFVLFVNKETRFSLSLEGLSKLGVDVESQNSIFQSTYGHLCAKDVCTYGKP